MAALRPAFTQLRSRRPTPAPQWRQLGQMLQGLQISPPPRARHARLLSTRPTGPDENTSPDEFASKSLEAAKHVLAPGRFATVEGASRSRSGEFDGYGEEGEDGEDGEGFPQGLESGTSISHARAVPISPSYFSRQPEFNDIYVELVKLAGKYAHLPSIPSDQVERVAFKSLREFRQQAGEEVKSSHYARCMTIVKRLHSIHPDLQTKAIRNAIAKFKRAIDPNLQKPPSIPIDKFGRALGVGRRKTSTARAWVVEGTGEVLVNGKSLVDAFGRVHDRESVVWALKATARVDKYNVWALVEGGGTTGQAEALAMAVGKALMAHEPALKPSLRRAGVVTRDPRNVERKKAGHLKARKSPTWVKR